METKKEMAMAPVDELGMPLPILQTDLPPGVTEAWNRHHAFYEKSAFLNGTEGSRAVRFSRLQYVPVWLHNRFHVMYRGGVELPANEYEEFKLTILGYAGYLPDRAVNVRKPEPVVYISRAQSRALRKPGIFGTELTEFSEYKNTGMGKFLIGYALKHGLEVADEKKKLTEQFLHAGSEAKMSLGLKLIERAAEVAAEPFELVYNDARRQRTLSYGAPTHPHRVVRSLITQVPNYPELLQEGLEQLAA